MPVSQTATLVTSVVTTLTFPNWGDASVAVELDSGGGPVYFTCDGSTPTIAGANEYVVNSIGEKTTVPLNPPEPGLSVPLPTLTVKLISAAASAPTVTVSGA